MLVNLTVLKHQSNNNIIIYYINMVIILKKNSSNENNLTLEELRTTNKQVVPILTTAERDAQTLEDGMIFYNSDTTVFEFREGGVTVDLNSGGSGGSININSGETYNIDSQISLAENRVVLRGTNTFIDLQGTTDAYVLFPNNSDIYAANGSQFMDLRYNLGYFCRFDVLNGSCALGGNLTLPNVRLNLFSGASQDHSLLLPDMSGAGETLFNGVATGSPAQYNGSIWHNSSVNEIRCFLNGLIYDLHHSGTTDITSANVSDVSSTIVGINDTQTLTNKSTESINFIPETPPTATEGKVFYDSSENTLGFYVDDNSLHHVGREVTLRVFNTGALISRGDAVYISGIQSSGEFRPIVSKAQANDETTARFIGLADSIIANNDYGYIKTQGYITGLETSLLTEGAPVYLSTDSAGLVTSEPPTANGNFFIKVGYCVKSDVSGSIFILSHSDTSIEYAASKRLILNVKKGSVGTLQPSDVVYVSGYDNGSNTVEVEKADNTSEMTTPAIGICLDNITNTTEGNICVSGKYRGFNATGYSVGDILYVSTNGTLTNIRPTNTSIIQKFAKVVKGGSQGKLYIFNSPSESLPNLALNNIWVGDSNAEPIATPLTNVAVDLNSAQTLTNKTLDECTFDDMQISGFMDIFQDSTEELRIISNNGTGDAVLTWVYDLAGPNLQYMFQKLDNTNGDVYFENALNDNTFRINQTGGYISYASSTVQNANGTNLFTLKTTANDNPEFIFDRNNSTNTAKIELSTGDMRFHIDGVQLATLDNSGLNLLSSGDSLFIASQQVVTARKTGWALPTGTSNRATFATSTVSLETLAQTVKALLEDIHASAGHGLIGT